MSGPDRRAADRPRAAGPTSTPIARPARPARGLAIALLAGALAATVPAGPAAGQAFVPAEAFRQSYTFLGNRLEIRVEGVPSGSLRVVRGGAGVLEVAGRAAEGIAGAARERDGSEVLTLTAVGAERAVFLVVVPSDAIVRLRLPGEERPLGFDPPRTSDQWEWSAPAPEAPEDAEDAEDAPEDGEEAPEDGEETP